MGAPIHISYSGGASSAILKYDITSLGSTVEPFTRTNYSPDQIYYDHSVAWHPSDLFLTMNNTISQDSIRAITCHPAQDEVFMTARSVSPSHYICKRHYWNINSDSEDGTIKRYDIRQAVRSPRDTETIQLEREITGLQYHPLIHHLFISSDCGGNILLWDARMAYTGGNVPTKGVLEKVSDLAYHTRFITHVHSLIYRLVPYKADAAIKTLSQFTRVEQRGVRSGRSVLRDIQQIFVFITPSTGTKFAVTFLVS